MKTHPLNHSFCVAPMMKCTDRYFRQMIRFFTSNAVLYTEMISCKAIIHGRQSHILDFADKEQPLALQVGGKDPAEMARCAELAEQWGYAEININAGCPSRCAQSGGFGAHLMTMPQRVAECVQAMRKASHLPVSVKCRIGVVNDKNSDNTKQYLSALMHFIELNHSAGCQTFIIHARPAILGRNLSPKDNRTIPSLDYSTVYQMKEAFPQCEIIINGGIQTLAHAKQIQEEGGLDGVMLGRAVYHNPLMVLGVDELFYTKSSPQLDSNKLIIELVDFIETHLQAGVPAGKLFKHLLSLLRGQRNAKHWRRWLTDMAQSEINDDWSQKLRAGLDHWGQSNIFVR